MKKDDYLKYLDTIGVDYHDLNVEITEHPYYPLCSTGVCKKDDKWIRYTGEERKGVIELEVCDEDDCFDFLKDDFQSMLYGKGVREVFKNKAYELTKDEIVEYIIKEYGYTPKNAEETFNNLKKVLRVLMEFKLYIKEGIFLSGKDAKRAEGWTAERLCKEQGLSPLGAFNYMIYLYEDPDEALEHLKKGLPIRKLIDEPSKIKEVNILEQKEKMSETAEVQQTIEQKDNSDESHK